MVLMRGYKILLLKAYFDKCRGVTDYLKYLIGFFAISSLNVRATLIIALFYGVLCFIVGWLWFKYKLVDTETEIGNRFNPFVKEMRRKI